MATRTFPSFLIYVDDAGEYRWRYQAAGNHETLADSGEGYTTYKACKAGAEMMQKSASATIWRTEGAADKATRTG